MIILPRAFILNKYPISFTSNTPEGNTSLQNHVIRYLSHDVLNLRIEFSYHYFDHKGSKQYSIVKSK